MSSQRPLFRERPVMDLDAGERRRDRGLEKATSGEGKKAFLELAREVKREEFRNHSYEWKDPAGKWWDVVDADTVRVEYNALAERNGWPIPDNPVIWGAVFREKGWIKVGEKKTEIPTGHARPIGRWHWEWCDL